MTLTLNTRAKYQLIILITVQRAFLLVVLASHTQGFLTCRHLGPTPGLMHQASGTRSGFRAHKIPQVILLCASGPNASIETMVSRT